MPLLQRQLSARARAPAEPHEERVVGLGAELDSSQQAERRVLLDRLVKLHHVQILHRYPPEYRPAPRVHSTHRPVAYLGF